MYYLFSKGEFYLWGNYDGPYGSLLSSLSIAQLKAPGYFQHPGIVPQLVWAAVIKITHMFQGNDPNIVFDTFDRPEFYLSHVYVIYAILTCATLFILGVTAYKKTGSIFVAIFLQLTPFISVMIINQMSKNTTETTTLILILIMLALVISYLYKNSFTKKENNLFVLYFGIVCGLLLANKISTLPILIIPFLLIRGFRCKGLFVLILTVVFLILLFLVSPQVYTFFKALYENIFSSGRYSAGPANFAETPQFMGQLIYIFNDFLLFCIIYFLIAFTLILQFIPKFKVKVRSNRFFLLLIGIFIVMNSFILIEVKSQMNYYLMPGILFSVIGLFAVNSVISDLAPKFFKKSRYIYIFIIFIIFTIPQINFYKKSVSQYSQRKKEAHRLINFLDENYSNSLLVSADFVSSQPTAIYNGLLYAGRQNMNYYSILTDRYPNFIYFQKWRKDFPYIQYNDDLKNRLLNSDTFIYQSFNEQNFNDFKEYIKKFTNNQSITYRELLSNPTTGEKLYLVKLKN